MPGPVYNSVVSLSPIWEDYKNIVEFTRAKKLAGKYIVIIIAIESTLIVFDLSMC